ncbi:MAG: hypothetical protein JXB10_04085 [Pirellulales bacterium]|nr:hypothetical protein [Pirellulales bacterium]
MHDLPIILLVFGTIAFLVILAGYGLKVFLAWMFRGFRRRAKPERVCVFCGRQTPVAEPRCHWCDREQTDALADELRDLDAFVRQLRRFAENQTVEAELADQWLRRAEAYRDRLWKPGVVPAYLRDVAPTPFRTPKQEEAPVLAEVVEEPPAPPPEPFALPLGKAGAGPAREIPSTVVSLSSGAAGAGVAPARKAPRKSFGEILSGFLEERNIHWAELIVTLVGGLLIVGCSIMMVINFWNKLEQVPALKFLVFIGYSSAIFGSGLFAYYRWRLPATGRCLLVIATLLVPLNFLALASLWQQEWNLVTAGLEAAALLLFAGLTWLSGKVLTPPRPGPLVLGVLGNAACILLMARLLGASSPAGAMLALGVLPPLVLWGATSSPLSLWERVRVRAGYLPSSPSPLAPLPMGEGTALSIAEINSRWLLLGMTLFATGVSLGLLVAQGVVGVGMPGALHFLAIPLILCTLPVLVGGLSVLQRFPREEQFEGYRIGGTMIALLGVVFQLTAVGMAWPQPGLLIAVGLLAAAALTWTALRYRFPPAQAGVMLAAALAYLAGFCLVVDPDLRGWQGQSLLIFQPALGGRLVDLVFSAKSGVALGGLFFLFAAASEVFLRRGRKDHGRMYIAGSIVAAICGLLLVTWHGGIAIFSGGLSQFLQSKNGTVPFWDLPADVLRAASLYAFYGLVCLYLAIRWRGVILSYVGINLLGAAPFWLLPTGAGLTVSFWITLAGCLAWAGLCWLALAWLHRRRRWFAAHHAVTILAVLCAVTAWLQYGNPAFRWTDCLTEPENLAAYGLGLAALGLVWLGVRLATAFRLAAAGTAAMSDDDSGAAVPAAAKQNGTIVPFSLSGNWTYLLQAGPAVDWALRHAVVWSFFGLTAIVFVFHTQQEIFGSLGPTAAFNLDGGTSWALLAVLAVSMTAALWQRWRQAEMCGSEVVLLTALLLAALQFNDQLAVASAGRWALGLGFLLLSAAVWGRGRLAAWSRRFRFQVGIEQSDLPAARGLAVGLAAAPVILLTLEAACLQLIGGSLAGPAPGSLFDQLGANWSYLIPLALVIGGLVGHALRESSAGYAFTAGLATELAVVLGYCLAVVTAVPPISFQVWHFVTVCQLATVTAAAWALVWMVARRWIDVWREVGPSDQDLLSRKRREGDGRLMSFQIGMAALGNFFLIGLSVLLIFFNHPHVDQWAFAEGGLWGWAALLLTLVAYGVRDGQNGKPLSAHVVGLGGMAVVALLACFLPYINSSTAAIIPSYWSYRVLMLGWGLYAFLIALGTWQVAAQRTLPGAAGPPQALIRLSALWVRAAALAAVVLGLKAGFFHPDADNERLWAAGAVALASLAGATMAVWRRREGWAFSAALGVNVAASLAVWHFEELRLLKFDEWWIRLVQANVIASAAGALLWLAARKRLFKLGEGRWRHSPLLALQVGLPVFGTILLLVVPLAMLASHPLGLPGGMDRWADTTGWVSLLLTVAAAAWYVYRTSPGGLMRLFDATGVAVGVMVACSAAGNGNAVFPWQEYHLLYTTWAAAALILLASQFFIAKTRLAAAGTAATMESDAGAAVPAAAKREDYSVSATSFCGILAVLFAVMYCGWDTDGVWWALRALGTMGVAAGVIALWRRSAAHVSLSGLIVNLGGVAVWFAWSRPDWTDLLEVQAVCFAATAAWWMLADRLRPGCVPHLSVGNRPCPYSHLAVGCGVGLLAVVSASGLAFDLSSFPHHTVDRLTWYAMAAVGGVMLLHLGDRRARFVPAGLYLCGLTALGFFWEALDMPPRMLYWKAGCDLAGFMLAAAVIGWLLPKIRHYSRGSLTPNPTPRDGNPGDRDYWSAEWFYSAQSVLFLLAGALSVWTTIDFGFDDFGRDIVLFGMSGRLTGVSGLLMLLGAAIVMAWQRESWRPASFIAGLLFLAGIRWSGIDPGLAAPWLHRCVALLTAGGTMAVVCGFGIPRFFPARSAWIPSARRMLPWFGALAGAALALVLIQEGWWFDSHGGAPVSVSEMIQVAVVLAVLLVGCLAFAVVKELDPFRLSDANRQAYVYAAEALGALIGLHLYLTRPEWFNLEIMRQYWMFVLLAVAYAGAGLSEWFQRRKLPVLSLPLERTALLLPLLPAVGFWFQSDPASSWGLTGRTPIFWFLAGGFYGLMASLRRSWGCLALAVLTANLGFWVALYQHDVSFFKHPQLWLIPLALAALATELLHHDRLSKNQSTLIRYVTLSVIYLSSSADMFIAGVGKDWRLPLVLMFLSVCGVVLGFVLRIRSFLILGVVFLLLDLISMIWYAAVDLHHTWIWYLCGIALGAALIAAFAFFERRRNTVLAAVQKLRQWER